MSMLSSSEFGEGNFTGKPITSAPDVTLPLALSKSTNTSFGQQTAWRSKPGMLSKQNFGSLLNFDDKGSTPMPDSDRGTSFGGN